MSRVVRFEQFLPVERSKFLAALAAADLETAKFEVSRMEITPPLMPGSVTGLVTVKLAASAIAFSYEDAEGNSWVNAFQEDLDAGRYGSREIRARDEEVGEPVADPGEA